MATAAMMDPEGYPLSLRLEEAGVPKLNLFYQVSLDQDLILTDFTVDTGSYRSSLSYLDLVEAGLDAYVQPCADEGFRGTIRLKLFSDLGDLLADEIQFWVWQNCDDNLLGMDFLTSTCSVLDLDPVNP